LRPLDLFYCVNFSHPVAELFRGRHDPANVKRKQKGNDQVEDAKY